MPPHSSLRAQKRRLTTAKIALYLHRDAIPFGVVSAREQLEMVRSLVGNALYPKLDFGVGEADYFPVELQIS